MYRHCFGALALLALLLRAASGVEVPVERIIGGQLASKGDFSHQVSIDAIFDVHLCGGSLLRNDWFVTSATCLLKVQPWIPCIMVTAGSTAKFSKDIQYSKISRIVLHEKYSYSSNNIAMARLSQPLVLNDWVNVIPFHNGQDGGGLKAVACGWHMTVSGVRVVHGSYAP